MEHTLNGSRVRKLLPWAYAAALAWINIYICREIFFLNYTPYTNSMHGVWMAMARLAPADHWIRPTWWPFWYCGAPFEYTYAPLIPDLTKAVAALAGWSHGRAFYAVSGFFFVLTPVVVFGATATMSRSSGYSFIGSLLYSLTALPELLVPDGVFKLVYLGNPRRLYLTVVWDEMPHLAALTFAVLATLFLWLWFRDGRLRYALLSGLAMALAVLANPFGGAMVAILGLCLAFALDPKQWKHHVLRTLAVGVVAYLVICPWFPPSLVETIRFNARRFDDGWTAASAPAFLAVALGWLLLWRVLHRWTRSFALRFFVFFAYLVSLIPILYTYLGVQFVPEPNRYKVEMEMALALALVFLVRPVVESRPPWLKAAVAIGLVFLAGKQVIGHRRWAKNTLRPVDIAGTIEYRVAQRVAGSFGGPRLMIPGSLQHWTNTFVDTPGFGGGSFPSNPNWVHQLAFFDVNASRFGQDSIVWLKAFGVRGVVVAGPRSTEFWKPYAQPDKFEGLLPVVWREDDVTLYEIPQRHPSLAHVVGNTAMVSTEPRHSADLAAVRDYVAAVESPESPPADFRWEGWNRAVIRTTVRRDQVVSVQLNYHRGWRARVGGKTVPVFRDGLGLLAVQPNCEGTCAVELVYDGGWEYRWCRFVSVFSMAGIVAGFLLRRRRGRRS